MIALNTIKENRKLSTAFLMISKIDKRWIFIATFGQMDKTIRNEIDHLKIPVIASKIDLIKARELGIG